MSFSVFFKLYRQPIALLVIACIAWTLFGWIVPSLAADHVLIAPLAAVSRQIAAPLLSSSLLLAAGLSWMYQSYEIWQWERGNRPLCASCGGPVAALTGRFGPYLRCLICSRTRSLR